VEKKPLNVLILEDSADDAALVARALARSGYAPRWERVETEEAFRARLSPDLDVILADYRLPGFDALGALALLQEADLDIPFLVVTGALGDEAAAACIREGADDFLLKDRLARLGSAVERALEQKRLREKRARDQARIRHLHAVLDAVRGVNRLIVRERDPGRLLADACALLVGNRGYRLVWVGLVSPGHKRVTPAARAGHGADFLDAMTITWDDGPFGEGVTGTAIRERRPDVCLDVARDPRMAPWREAALARGTRSSLAVPLLYGAKLFGSLTVYADRPDAFDEEEVDLLLELAGDLAFALQGIEEEARRKEAEKALQESEERFRQLFEQNEEAVLLFKTGTAEIVGANPAAEALYGYSREELIARGPSLLVNPENRQDFEEAIGGIGKEAGLNVERMILLRRDGEKIVASLQGHSIRLRDGRVTYCAFRDITERVRLEEEARLQQAQLIHASRMATLGTIVSGVAHEINNPNNLIMFNAPLVAAAWQDAAPVLETYAREHGDFSLGGLSYAEMREIVPRLLDGISDASQRIKAIVGGLKTLARRDQPHPDDPVDVNEVVRMAVSILKHEILKGTDRFQVAYESGLPPVRGSGLQLEQVVINLLANALQALPDTGRGIRVATQTVPTEGCVEIRVEDEGIGMAQEVLERLTEPFFSTRQESGGLGLGLSICREIVTEHGGFLVFESEPGRGTTVRVRLPCPGSSTTGGGALTAI
jgi:PAS domain S-box-containing protein